MTAAAPARRSAPAVSNAVLGMIFAVIAESMFFVGLVFAALQIRRGMATWPPPGAPEIDVRLLALNTAVLVVSSIAAHRASRSARAGDGRTATLAIGGAAALGTAFLIGQIAQFAQLGGWRPMDGPYGTMFELLAGFHGLHAAIGIALLLVVLTWTRRAKHVQALSQQFLAAEIYWHFVTAVWLALLVVWFVPW